VCRAISHLGGSAKIIWHTEASVGEVDAVVLPGGFAHGDYLRTGAIARFSPVMAAVRAFGELGGPVVGICNGFQVLTESGMLPGALRSNAGMRFISETIECVVSSTHSVLTANAVLGARLFLPINHYEGNFVADEATLDALEENGQVVLSYASNPNGSSRSIAGIANRAGNVVGIMPHPERASDELLGSTDGQVLLASLLDAAIAFAERSPDPSVSANVAS
jgi:phosphoribosylformylglycinamidine synthase